jgi:hypothetical protein
MGAAGRDGRRGPVDRSGSHIVIVIVIVILAVAVQPAGGSQLVPGLVRRRELVGDRRL